MLRGYFWLRDLEVFRGLYGVRPFACKAHISLSYFSVPYLGSGGIQAGLRQYFWLCAQEGALVVLGIS